MKWKHQHKKIYTSIYCKHWICTQNDSEIILQEDIKNFREIL